MRNKMISALLATAMVASMITVPVLASETAIESANGRHKRVCAKKIRTRSRCGSLVGR